MKIPADFLNRYTTLPVLLDVLVRKRLILLNPQLWEDRNDAFSMEQYKIAKTCRTVLGLCFSEARETFHHWKVFSNGMSGVCIEFRKRKLLRKLPQQPQFKHGSVEYKTFKKVETHPIVVEQVPFLKRYPYRDEKEYRIIYESCDEDIQTKEIPITLDCIRTITLSPWIPLPIAETLIDVIRSIPGCDSLTVNRSTLIESDRWKKAIIDRCSSVKP